MCVCVCACVRACVGVGGERGGGGGSHTPLIGFNHGQSAKVALSSASLTKTLCSRALMSEFEFFRKPRSALYFLHSFCVQFLLLCCRTPPCFRTSCLVPAPILPTIPPSIPLYLPPNAPPLQLAGLHFFLTMFLYDGFMSWTMVAYQALLADMTADDRQRERCPACLLVLPAVCPSLPSA